ncbi:hypothetical protein BD770DRAFT_440590 [Pilaira anomala]|nr:hypothetical protein BD770DRAFT_440590 [Pilaira anomala]
MLRLPFEILIIISSHLSANDLLELVNEADKSFTLVRTLSNSNRLGNYAQNINCSVWYPRQDEKCWDQFRLVNTLIKRCPNLLVLSTGEVDVSLWIRLSQAAKRGQLSRLLRELPYADMDLRNYFGTDFRQLKEYQTLKYQLSEFRNFQILDELEYYSNKQLSQFDAIIEGCPHLKILAIESFTY